MKKAVTIFVILGIVVLVGTALIPTVDPVSVVGLTVSSFLMTYFILTLIEVYKTSREQKKLREMINYTKFLLNRLAEENDKTMIKSLEKELSETMIKQYYLIQKLNRQ